METRRRLPAEERRERILEAALDLFSERGFAASTTRELAARAGISEAVIYRHFRSKAEVLRAVVERYSLLPHLRRLADAPAEGSLHDQLVELGRHWRRMSMDRRALIALLLAEMGREPEIARTLRETLVHQAVPLIVAALQRGGCAGIPRDRLETAVRMYLASLFSHFLIEERLGADVDPNAEAQIAARADLIVRALTPAEPRQGDVPAG